jgi:putative aldouronate transport system substrate-binding protein
MKKNVWIRLVMAILTLSLITLSFAGCAKEEQTGEETKPIETTSQATTTEATTEATEKSNPALGGLTLPIVDNKLELSMWMQLSPKRANIIKDMSEMPMIEELERRTNIHIKWVNPPAAQAKEQLNLMIASNDLTDIMSHNIPNPLEYANDGVIIPIQELIKENAPNFSRLMEEIPRLRKEITYENGDIYGMGTLRAPWSGIELYMPRIFIRKDWLDKVGKQLPQTMDDWYDVHKAFKEAGDLNGNGKDDEVPYTTFGFKVEGLGDISIQSFFIRPFGIVPGFYQNDGKVNFGAIQPEYKEALSMIRKWYAEGLIDQDFLIQDINQLDAKVYNSQVGSLYGLSVRHFAKGNDSIQKADPNAEYVVAPFPKPMDGSKNPYQFEPQTYNISTGALTVITSANKYPAESIKWLDYMYSYEGEVFSEFGQIGVTCEVKNGELVSILDEVAEKEGISIEQALGKYKIGYNSWCKASIPFDPDHPWYKEGGFDYKIDPFKRDSTAQALAKYGWSLDTLQDYKTWNNSRILPAITFTKDETDRITTKYTEIKNYVTDMFARFVTGKASIDEFDDYVAQVNKMGIEEVSEVYQTALDRYNATESE